MLDFNKLESQLENQIVRTVAAVGVLLIIGGIFNGILNSLFSALESDLIFDGFWNLTYLQVLAILAAGGLWAALAVTRSWEQPWWMIVLGAFAAWSLVVMPAAIDMPNFLANLLFIVGFLAELVGAMLALVLLDKAIPRAAASFGGAGSAGAGPAGQVYGGGQSYGGGQQYDQSYDSGQQYRAEAESQGGTPPGWYPDPHGEATSRWWDGNAWSNNVR